MSNENSLTRKDPVALDQKPSRAQEIATKGDVERLKNYGRVLSIVQELVKTGHTVVKSKARIDELDAEVGLVEAETRKLALTEDRLKQHSADTANILREAGQRLQTTIREDVPAALELLGDASAEARVALIKAVLERLPKIEVSR